MKSAARKKPSPKKIAATRKHVAKAVTKKKAAPGKAAKTKPGQAKKKVKPGQAAKPVSAKKVRRATVAAKPTPILEKPVRKPLPLPKPAPWAPWAGDEILEDLHRTRADISFEHGHNLRGLHDSLKILTARLNPPVAAPRRRKAS